MKRNKYIGIMMLAATMFGAASCSDYSDYNTVPVSSQPGADQTLWQNISSDPQLTKFATLAKQCNFSEALNSPRFYTVWAPTDDAIDPVEYERLLESDSATVLKEFIQQHITEYNYPVSSALEDKTIVSLNLKHHDFTQTSFDEFPYTAINLPSSNGVMHKISGYSEFFNNLYENIDNLVGCDSLKKYVQKYDIEVLDPNNSVIGPIKDGKQTYLDSVMRKQNTVIASIMRASLDNEDSTYCMVIPNDEAWRAAYEKIAPYYNYISKMDYMDLSKKTTVASSTTATTAKADEPATTTSDYQDSLTCRNIVRNLVFSNSTPRNQALFDNTPISPNDSLLSTPGNYLQNGQEILNHTVEMDEMSNGLARVVDSLTFDPWQTYAPSIVSTMPAQTLKVKDSKESTLKKTIPLDDLKARRDTLFSKVPKMFYQWLFPAREKFFTYYAVDSTNIDGTTGKPELNFALNGVRSTTYHIYVITVPEQISNEYATATPKPYYLRFYLSWTDASNKQQYTVLPQGARSTYEITTADGASTATLTYVGDPGRVNVLDLGEFTFPACYAGTDAYPSLMMMHTKTYTSAQNRNRYEQQMRVAGVYLIPKEYNDYWANKE